MPRDWMDDRRGRDERRAPWESRGERRGPEPGPESRPESRDDFGQADFSNDYVYDPDHRVARRVADEHAARHDDYGQADYSDDYAYDPDRGRGFRRFSEDDRDYDRGYDRDDGRDGRRGAEADRGYGRRMDCGDYRSDRRDDRDGPDRGERSRSWMDRAGAFFGGREDSAPQRRRRGPSDRVLWTVIVERLEDERGLDLREVEVLVDDAEVTLNGLVRRKEDKRRIEDIADIDGVRHVQNNLRVRETRRWF